MEIRTKRADTMNTISNIIKLKTVLKIKQLSNHKIINVFKFLKTDRYEIALFLAKTLIGDKDYDP